MKKNYIVAFVFIAGIVCGYSFSQFSPYQDETIANTIPINNSTEENEESSNRNNDANRTRPKLTEAQEQDLFNTLLPSNSPLWLEVNFAQIRAKGENVGDFFKMESVQPIWDKMISSFPNEATKVFKVFAETNDLIRIFSSPLDDSGQSKLIIAGQPTNSDRISHNPFDDWVAALPDAATREAEVGVHQFRGITTPLGEWTIAQDTHLNWYANDPQGLENVFNNPPTPPEEKPQYQDISEQHKDAVGILVVNSIKQAQVILPFGLFALSEEFNVEQTALVLSWPKDESSLTLLAHADESPDWVEDWQHLNDVMFSVSDPVGIVEGAIQWPGNLPQQQIEQSAQPSEQTQDNENRSENRRQRNRPGGGGSPGGPGAERNNISQQASGQFLSRLFPDNYPMGFNFFGFYQGKPAFTFAFPELQETNAMFDRLNRLSQNNIEEIEIANLIGKKYGFTSMLTRRNAGLDSLFVIKRDAITYLFDNQESALNYLTTEGSLPDRSSRTIELRNLYDRTKNSSQIKLLLSEDFFEYIMNQEIQYWQDNPVAKLELEFLFEDIKPHLSPISISAGYKDNEWFIDQYSNDKLGHFIGLMLAILGAYRFL